MLNIPLDDEIYATDGGRLKARWHFSFDHYRVPENDSFGTPGRRQGPLNGGVQAKTAPPA